MKHVRKLGWAGLLFGVIMFALGFCTGKVTTNNPIAAHGMTIQKVTVKRVDPTVVPAVDDMLARRLERYEANMSKLVDEVGGMRQELGNVARSLADLTELVRNQPEPAPTRSHRRRG